MNLLLDTHILLWAAIETGRLPKGARELLEDPGNRLFYSAASFIEISIKMALGRKDFDVDARVLRRGLRDNGYVELPITADHGLALQSLPPIHKDPFDRILVAQAIAEGLMLVTVDAILARYPGPIRKL
jgi:PIN domain nuclease of toxin-antitoxin system